MEENIKTLIEMYKIKILECKEQNIQSLALMKKCLSDYNEGLYNMYKNSKDTNDILISNYQDFVNELKNLQK